MGSQPSSSFCIVSSIGAYSSSISRRSTVWQQRPDKVRNGKQHFDYKGSSSNWDSLSSRNAWVQQIFDSIYGESFDEEYSLFNTITICAYAGFIRGYFYRPHLLPRRNNCVEQPRKDCSFASKNSSRTIRTMKSRQRQFKNLQTSYNRVHCNYFAQDGK